MARGVKLEGFEELIKKFDQLENSQAEKNRMMTVAAEEIKKEIKTAANGLDDNIFTGENMKFGTLEENIGVEIKEGSVFVTTGNAYWSIMLEHGTVYHEKKPFFYKSFNKARNRALKKIEKEMKERLGL